VSNLDAAKAMIERVVSERLDALAELDALFFSLQSRAFNGELVA
jgi:hypothetical protein